MSFSEDVRNELAREECPWPCCARAQLAVALLLGGGIAFRGPEKYGLSLSTEHNSVSRYFFALIKRHYGAACEIRTLKTARLGERVRYQITVPPENVGEIMHDTDLFDENGLFGVRAAPLASLTGRECCKTAFVKSAFLTAGSLSSPETEYFLGISAASEEMAQSVLGVMLQLGLRARVSPRKAQYVVYLKGAEDISQCLARIGAHSAVLRLENTRIVKEIRNQANRAANCDSNNIERTVRGAQAQIEEIERVLARLGEGALSPQLLEIARLRLADPNASLAELGEMCAPPIGKSGVNNRLRRISELANNIREEKRV